MARHKNMPWNLPEGTPNDSGGRTHSWESIHTALLMDLRDELQALNTLLGCKNVRAGFLALRSIARVQRANLKREVEREIRRREKKAKKG